MTTSIKNENTYSKDLANCERWMPLFDQDKINKYQILNQKLDVLEANKNFFKKFRVENGILEDKKFFFEFKDLVIFFHLNDASFSFKLKNSSANSVLYDSKLLSEIKSPFILCPYFDESEKANIFPFRFGDTLEKIIEDNEKNHILDESDLLLLSIEITMAMKDLYNANNNNKQYTNRKISDRSFFVDYMKNVYLFSISDNNIHESFSNKHISDQKAKDIYTLKILLEEILKEKSFNDELRGNQNYNWYHNFHEELNKILGRFNNNKYKDFDEIIKALKETSIYRRNSDQINDRLNNAIENSQKMQKSSFFESLLCQSTLNYDIQTIYNQLFIRLRESSLNQSYFLFFNLILHIFFPTKTVNDRSIDCSSMLELFDSDKLITTINNDLLTKSLLDDELFKGALGQIYEEISEESETQELNKEDINEVLSLLDSTKLFDLIKDELSNQNHSKSQTFFTFLQKVYFHYFPGNKAEISPNYIYDYFGIIQFIINKDDLIYITHPKISDVNMNRLNSLTSYKNLNSFFKNSFKNQDYDYKTIMTTIEGFDFANASHKLLFNFEDSSFYIEREYKFDGEKFQRRVEYQDELFNKVETNENEFIEKKIKLKYLLHLNNERNRVKHTNYIGSSTFPLFTYSLCRIIQQNGKRKFIEDSDKILWAIQIAYAFEALNVIDAENESENKMPFVQSIHDQFFLVDCLKNIYLGALAFNTESDNDSSTSNPHLYFYIKEDTNCIYKYGVLLFEIFSEIEPKNLFGNESRESRVNILAEGYSSFGLFNKYKEKFAKIYGDDIGKIVDRCIDFKRPDKFNEFSEIINELKNTQIYKKYKYVVDKRERETQPVDSSYKCSFKSLLLSSVTGMRDAYQILKTFNEKMIELSPTDEIQSTFQYSLQLLNNGQPQGCYFNSINRYSLYEKLEDDQFLSKIVSRIFYKNNGQKAVRINESEIQKLIRGVKNMTFFNQVTKLVEQGISPLMPKDATFSENTILRCSEKVPIVSLDYYIQKDFRDQNMQKWIYQIIYFLNVKNFFLSTDPMSYDIKITDLALFYNNITGQFDADLSPNSEYKIRNSYCRNEVNVYSFAELIQNLTKGEFSTYDFNHLVNYDFANFNQFISCCLLLKQKKAKKQNKCEKLFELFLKDGFCFYEILNLYENQLIDEIDAIDYASITDHSNYDDVNYRIWYSNFIEIMSFFSGDKEKVYVNNDLKSGYFFTYENDLIINQNFEKYKDVLKIIFPEKSFDLNSDSSLIDVVKLFLGKRKETDEKEFHSRKSDDKKLYLIMKIFPDEDFAYLYKIFHLNDQKLYDTLEFLIEDSEKEYNLNDYDRQMNIECLLINFPQVKLEMIDSIVDEKIELINNFIEKTGSKKQILIDGSKKVKITNQAQIIVDELKDEIKQKFEQMAELDDFIQNQRYEIEVKMRQIKKGNSYKNEDEQLKQNNYQIQSKEDQMIKLFKSNLKRDIILDIQKNARAFISACYDKFNKDYLKTTDFLVFKYHRFEAPPNYEIADYTPNYEIADYTTQMITNKGHQFKNNVVSRTLEIYSDLDPNSYKFLIKRYINQLNPRYNYELTLKIQNLKKTVYNTISLSDLENFMSELPYPRRSEGGNLKITICKTLT